MNLADYIKKTVNRQHDRSFLFDKSDYSFCIGMILLFMFFAPILDLWALAAA